MFFLFGFIPLLAEAAPAGVRPTSGPLVLSVRANGSLPGFTDSELSTYLVRVMAGVDHITWRFVPSPATEPPPPNRIDFSFKTNAYAAGTVRAYGFSRATMERLLGVRHSVTIEARLFLGGDYQTLDFEQVTLTGGQRDQELVAAVAKLTRLLKAYTDLDTRSQMPRPGVPSGLAGTS